MLNPAVSGLCEVGEGKWGRQRSMDRRGYDLYVETHIEDPWVRCDLLPRMEKILESFPYWGGELWREDRLTVRTSGRLGTSGRSRLLLGKESQSVPCPLVSWLGHKGGMVSAC